MGDELTTTGAAGLSAAQADLLDGAREHIRAARSSATQRAYAGAWRRFETWCASNSPRLEPLPASTTTVVMYLTALDRGGRKPATIDLALTAICARHRASGLPSPRDAEPVTLTRQGIRNTRGVEPRKVLPLLVEDLRGVVRKLDLETVAGVRDRALLLVGFAAALRESEIVALNVEDVEIRRGKACVTVRRSKTDQEGRSAAVGFSAAEDLALCPIAALRRWLKLGEVRAGPIFRPIDRWENVLDRRLGVRSVDAIVKRAVDAAGLDSAGYAGHSLRAGLATSAAEAGKSLEAIMRQTRHQSADVARGYIRHVEMFRDNAADGLL